MARRFSALRRQHMSSGRKTFWIGGTIVQTTLVSANSAAIITSLNAAALGLLPFTVIRSRGWWGMNTDQVSTDEDQHAIVGNIVVSDEAVAVGITAVPTPVSESGSNWFMLDGAAQRFEFGSAIGLLPNSIPERYVFDSKAMRKVEEGQDVITVIEAGPSSSGLTLVLFQRMLVKLH